MNSSLSIRSAPLPVNYQEVRMALAKCIRVDECRRWAAKADALASYARQMRDNALMIAAQRIQDRAMIRAGELLLEIEAEKGKHRNSTEETLSGRQQAAEAAGLSPKQAADAVAAAKVPAEEADALIESEEPPTISQLAEKGRTKRPKSIEPDEFSDEWADWVFRIKRLSVLPECGLGILVGHPLTAERGRRQQLITQAHQTIENLHLWIQALEENDD